jgi:hypothetical protein
LAWIGIYVKSPAQMEAEYQAAPPNAWVFSDWPTVYQPALIERQITPDRLNPAKVRKLIADEEQVFGISNAGWRQTADRLAAGIADYRAVAKPADGKIRAPVFASFVMSHQGAAAETILAQKLSAMRQLADDVAALNLSAAEVQAVNRYWTYSLTPRDPNLVNDQGIYDPHWLLDVLNALPGN